MPFGWLVSRHLSLVRGPRRTFVSSNKMKPPAAAGDPRAARQLDNSPTPIAEHKALDRQNVDMFDPSQIATALPKPLSQRPSAQRRLR